MALPPFLLMEVRTAFRTCARQNAFRRNTAFSTLQCLNRRAPNLPQKHSSAPPLSPQEPRSGSRHKLEYGTKEPKDLVPTEEEGKSLDTDRRSDVPMRVIPKSSVGPKARLSPQERLHIEHLTRHPPPQRPTKGYKENLLVYHLGNARVGWMIFTRVTATCMVGFMTIIWIPSYYNYGLSIWALGAIWAASFIPLFTINWATRGVLTEIRLKLPPSARQSAHAAINYAKNLPRDAVIEARFQRWTSHTAAILIKVVDTVPAQTRFKPISFRWTGPRVDHGTRLFPNPTHFWVRSKTAQGKAARDTVPGLWETIYKRLAGLDGAGQKWKG